VSESKKGLASLGIPEPSDVAALLPGQARLAAGPVAIIECFQEIPCDPCSAACPQGAISPFAHVCDLPEVDHGLCNGCGVCVARCPGLAIFVVDLSGDGPTGTVQIPYEYLPLPQVGEEVWAVDRHGAVLGPAKVISSRRPRAFDRTALVTFELPRQQVMAARGLRLKRTCSQERGGGDHA